MSDKIPPHGPASEAPPSDAVAEQPPFEATPNPKPTEPRHPNPRRDSDGYIARQRIRWREKRRHAAHPTRSIAHTLRGRCDTLLGRVALWLLPWPMSGYPGVIRGMGEFCGVPAETARAYRSGHRPLPPEIAESLADLIERLCTEGRLLVQNLRECAAEARRKPKRPPSGCCALGPDGLSKRWRGGKRGRE